MDVRENASGGDGHSREELVELLVVADRELEVARRDAHALVVTRSVARKLEDLGAEILEARRHVDRGATAEAVRHLHAAHEACDAADRELESRLRTARLALASLLLAAPSFSFAAVGESGE